MTDHKRERERERETERQTDRQTDRQTETERQRHRETETIRERKGKNGRGSRNTIKKKLSHTEVRKPQKFRNISREQWFKKLEDQS